MSIHPACALSWLMIWGRPHSVAEERRRRRYNERNLGSSPRAVDTGRQPAVRVLAVSASETDVVQEGTYSSRDRAGRGVPGRTGLAPRPGCRPVAYASRRGGRGLGRTRLGRGQSVVGRVRRAPPVPSQHPESVAGDRQAGSVSGVGPGSVFEGDYPGGFTAQSFCGWRWPEDWCPRVPDAYRVRRSVPVTLPSSPLRLIGSSTRRGTGKPRRGVRRRPGRSGRPSPGTASSAPVRWR